MYNTGVVEDMIVRMFGVLGESPQGFSGLKHESEPKRQGELCRAGGPDQDTYCDREFLGSEKHASDNTLRRASAIDLGCLFTHWSGSGGWVRISESLEAKTAKGGSCEVGKSKECCATSLIHA